ncbi:hypothetical protein BU25DRAFT_372725 [Macroventuria anomochaeta]|uniref:Uncharacterized protein n=1 Tax=Macroventuria anomochaeta TaxID=301207 RepID=A0ACB6RUZ6_9PLEO|nr:uncharacterized protein BU25DRAFT_372725 [Macroventuria anomochaeta]KAF2625107.1 hypothetical protein BU25DRAFT_372725 [Macroventuria anomochaeta]
MSNVTVAWSDEYQAYFRQTYNYTTDRWEFLDWNVPATDNQATNNYSAQAQSGAESRLPRGEGPAIHGDYIPGGQSLHYEELDYSFQVRSSSFFSEGRAFAVMWNETAGATLKPVDYNTSRSLSEVKHAGNIVYTNVRRFVVVRRKREFCFACPIFTYSQRGTTKNGVRASEHAIVHSWGKSPQLIQGEIGITKPSIAIVMAEGVPPLHFASRIYFGIHHPIQYNVKVKDIGYVPSDQVHTLIGNWTEENEGTNQASDVTANAD